MANDLESEKVRESIDTPGTYPYYYPQLFPRTKGWGSTGDIKKRVKLLKSIEPTLEKLLSPGEELRFVTTGMFCSFAEPCFWAFSLI